MLLKDTPISQPLDIVLGLLLPLHAHFGLNSVVSDYVPKSFRTVARGSVVLMTLVTIAGITELNISGPGITKTVLGMWKPRPSKDEKHPLRE
jgi:succinate dehydrogenase (ubiquinone) membrane anchor subunit